jgi:dyslexia susceptibility 1 candidate gene 1 protein
MEDKIEEVNSRMISDFVSSDSKVSNDQSVDEDNIRYIPPPRSVTNGSENGGSNAFGITFTPRIFPTPMRESKASEEEDWIAKNRKHLKHHGVFGNKITKGNGVDITEEDPAWLKAKADDFFRSGDYLSAVNAYSAVVDMDDPVYYIPCLSNRSTCYLKLNNLNECKDDCVLAISRLLATDTNGVNIMFEDLPVDKMSIAIKLLMRRGICNCQLGQFHDSIEDYSQALKLVTLYKYKSGNDAVKGVTDETIGVDIDNLSKLETADNLKKNADSQLATGAFDDAERLYSEALIKVPAHVGCLSNRAACKMAKHNFNGCVDDCTIALNIFDSDDIVNRKKAIGSSDGISMLSAILPPYGSDKRKSWYLKTLTRRGAAYVQLKDLDSAIADFGKASSLDSSDKQLQKDLNSLITLRAKKNQSEQN